MTTGAEKHRPVFAAFHRGGRRLHIGLQARASPSLPRSCCANISLRPATGNRPNLGAATCALFATCAVTYGLALIPQEFGEDLSSAAGAAASRFGTNVMGRLQSGGLPQSRGCGG